MADIELVIKISEETYKDIQSRDWKNGALIFSKEWKAIHNGTPLPKGHGKLKDVNKVLEEIKKEILSLKGDNFPNSYYVKIIDKHIKKELGEGEEND